jgi:hypothetical protein
MALQIKNIEDDSAQLSMITESNSVALKKKELEEQLIEEILANTSQQVQNMPAASSQQKSDGADVQVKVGATNNPVTSSQTAILDQHLDFLTNTLTTDKASGLTVQKQMIKNQALRSDMQEKPRLMGTAVHAKLKGSLGDDSWPSPYSGMPSGAPQPSQGDGPDFLLGNSMAIYELMFTYNGNVMTDPVGLDNLMQQIFNDTANGKLAPGSDLLNFLMQYGDLTGQSDVHDSFIGVWANQAAEYAFFSGFNGQTGQAGMQAWKDAMTAKLNSVNSIGNPLIGAMKECVNDIDVTNFSSTHTQGNDLIWTTPDGETFDWTNPGQYSDDQNQIMGLINGQTTLYATDGQISNTVFNDFNLKALQKAYRVDTLKQLMGKYKDPAILLVLFMLMISDSDLQGSMTGENKITDLLTAGQKYANEMTDAIAYFAAGPDNTGQPPSAKDKEMAAKFEDAVLGMENFVKNNPQLGSTFQGSIDSEVVQALNGVMVQGPPGSGDPQGLVDILKACASGGGSYEGWTTVQWLATAFAPSPTGSSGSGPIPPPNPNNTLAINIEGACQNLWGGQSKAAQTTTSQIASQDTQVMQSASAIDKNFFSMFSQIIKAMSQVN